MVLFEPYNEREPDSKDIAAMARRCSLPYPATRILMNRGFTGKDEILAFLSPGLNQLLEPLLLPDMDKAVQTIREAIESKKRIFLFGDYDVDGVCAVSILFEHIRALGGVVEYRVPRRHEGYGLSVSVVEEIAQRADLLVTLDCGITSAAEIERANELGLLAVVTDHHQCPAILPPCPCVNAHRPDSSYPFKHLCGTGVAAKLIEALSGVDALVDYLDRIALATVADIVPLTGENRVFVAEGLKRIEQGACLGLEALIERSGVPLSGIKSSHLAFAIAPRVNAAGRIGDAMRAIELLTTKDEKRAKELSADLDEENKRRQGIELEILNEALEMLRSVDLVEDRAILLASQGWHPGVTGIVASRLTERFNKPVLLFHEEDGLLTASGRSIPTIHLFNALNHFADMFVRFGGHAQAAGLTIKKEDYEGFRKAFLQHMRQYESGLFLPTAKYDAQVNVSEIDAKLVRALERFAPFGFGNQSPVLRVKANAHNARTMGADNAHLRITLADGRAQMPSVGFCMGDRLAEFAGSAEVDALICAEMDTYRGNGALRSILRYVRPDTMAPAESIADRNSHVFFEAFMRDAALPPADEPRESEKDTDARLEAMLKEDIQGALIIARTPSGALKALKALDRLGIRERVELSFKTLAPGNDNAYNTLLLAPEMDAFERRRFKNVLMYDTCLTGAAYGRLRSACEPGAKLIIAGTGGCEELLSGIDPDRKTLGAYYRALRRIASGAYEFPQFEGLFVASRKLIINANRAQLLFALCVFEELGFLGVQWKPGIKITVGSETKKELAESAAYRFINEFQSSS